MPFSEAAWQGRGYASRTCSACLLYPCGCPTGSVGPTAARPAQTGCLNFFNQKNSPPPSFLFLSSSFFLYFPNFSSQSFWFFFLIIFFISVIFSKRMCFIVFFSPSILSISFSVLFLLIFSNEDVVTKKERAPKTPYRHPADLS